jgi:ketosteroid isomerase-like protein
MAAMQVQHDPRTLAVRRFLAAMRDEDGRTMMEVLHPGIRWEVTGSSSISGEYVGREAVFGYFARIVDLVGGSFAWEAADISVDEETVRLRTTTSANRGGHVLSVTETLSFRLEDGVVTSCRQEPEDQATWDQFWS